MERNPSGEDNRHSAGHEISRLYGTYKIITVFITARYLSLS